MRIAFKGSLAQLFPLVLKFTADTTWDPADYIELGYTNFDVICIGGGGGLGGGCDGADTATPANHLRSFGGQGGGGGFHRARGLLAAVAGTIPINVGLAGAPGADNADPASTTDGGDGTYSSFANSACLATGGKGGKRVQSLSLGESPFSDGGDGGNGDTYPVTAAGGGGIGGTAGTVPPSGPHQPATPGEGGILIAGVVGKGGGGGAGGVALYDVGGGEGSSRFDASYGGRGSYDASELVFGPAGNPSRDPVSHTNDVVAGIASGARVTPLDNTTTVYGKSGQPGIVVVRLTVG